MIKKKLCSIILCVFVVCCAACSSDVEYSIKDWDLKAIAYDEKWDCDLWSNPAYQIGVIDIDEDVYSDNQQEQFHHHQIIEALIKKIAPKCKICSICLSDNPNSSDIINAIQELSEQGCRVINISLGTTETISFPEELRQKMESGQLYIVCAAGNGKKGILYPAASDGAICVLAKDINNGIAKLDLMDEGFKKSFSAPGMHININGNYFSGSSFATVYVAIAFAALATKTPERSYSEMMDFLCDNATNSAADCDYGVIQFSKLLP